MNITYTKKLSGIPEDQVVIKEIVDEQIMSKIYAMRIADYVLDAHGRKWWQAQGTMAATEMLYQFDDVEFWVDGVNYEGFIAENPDINFSVKQREANITFKLTIWFLK